MDFCLFLQEQNHKTEPAAHRISRRWANLITSQRIGHKVGQNSVQLNVPRTWKEVKTLLRAEILSRPAYLSSNYIPEELPAAEIPGVKFVLAKTCNYQPEAMF